MAEFIKTYGIESAYVQSSQLMDLEGPEQLTKCEEDGDEPNTDPENEDELDDYTVPTFCCLQVSDTGNFIRWKNVKNATLQPGDHVAWLRWFMGLWHHAIVEKVWNNNSITVIEWSGSSPTINKRVRSETDMIANWGYSPMYKAYYPNKVVSQNPADLVLQRANSRIDETGYNLLTENCEHFATFCKTGVSKSNQVFQMQLTMRGWIRRVIISIIHIAIIMSFSELIELKIGEHQEWVGAILLLASEFVHLLVVFCVTYCYDTKQEGFATNGKPECTRACRCTSIKAVLQSVLAVGMAIVFIVVIGPRTQIYQHTQTAGKRAGVEIMFGIIGGIIGNILSFFIFSFIPYPCCRNELAPESVVEL